MEDKLEEDISEIRAHHQYFNQVDWDLLKKHLDLDQLHEYLKGLQLKQEKIKAADKGAILDTVQAQDIQLKNKGSM